MKANKSGALAADLCASAAVAQRPDFCKIRQHAIDAATVASIASGHGEDRKHG